MPAAVGFLAPLRLLRVVLPHRRLLDDLWHLPVLGNPPHLRHVLVPRHQRRGVLAGPLFARGALAGVAAGLGLPNAQIRVVAAAQHKAPILAIQ